MQQQGTLGLGYELFRINTLPALRSANRVNQTVNEVVARVKNVPVENDAALSLVMARVTQAKGISLSDEEEQKALLTIKRML